MLIDISWRLHMKTLSALLTICEGNPTVAGRFLSQWTTNAGFMFSLIYVYTNSWSSNLVAGDLIHNDSRLTLLSWNVEYMSSFEFTIDTLYVVPVGEPREVLWTTL